MNKTEEERSVLSVLYAVCSIVILSPCDCPSFGWCRFSAIKVEKFVGTIFET